MGAIIGSALLVGLTFGQMMGRAEQRAADRIIRARYDMEHPSPTVRLPLPAIPLCDPDDL